MLRGIPPAFTWAPAAEELPDLVLLEVRELTRIEEGTVALRAASSHTWG